MFQGIFYLIMNIVTGLSNWTVNTMDHIFVDVGYDGLSLGDIDFNLTLFSDNPIISTNMWDLLSLFFTIFYTMFFIILLYKATKKFITMVFGVFRV